MQYRETAVAGAFVVSLEPRSDDRGAFARLFCSEEFKARGLDGTISQINNSVSIRAGTLRGLHYQVAPHGEVKMLRCLRGAAYDVVVDLRPGSATFGRWAAETLSADNRLMMYVPKGCAHGFLTLEDDTEMLYPASSPYNGPAERTLRWDDPRFSIAWPCAPTALSDKDRDAVDYDPAWHASGY